jgi:hypothetical protein
MPLSSGGPLSPWPSCSDQKLILRPFIETAAAPLGQFVEYLYPALRTHARPRDDLVDVTLATVAISARIEGADCNTGRRGIRCLSVAQHKSFITLVMLKDGRPSLILAHPLPWLNARGRPGELKKMNPLKSIQGTIIAGIVLALVIGGIVGGLQIVELSWYRWIHILAGITWIGLLYYFNFVQVPALAAAAADKGGPGGAGISKYVAPRALLWFRMSAGVTWVMGFLYLLRSGNIHAFALGLVGGDTVNMYQLVIGIGAWLGTIMLFNVWVLIWPNQKKILGLVPATDEEKAKARNIASLASRMNTLLSIPMIMCMLGASHGLPL